jgi:membrane protease subunit HflC
MRRIPIPTVATAALLVAIFVAYMVTKQVRFSENAVRVRFGKADASSVIRQPGLYLRWPAPIERVRDYDMRLRVLDTPETEIKTRDGQALIVGCFAIWKIEDPLKFYVRVPNERDAREKLRTRINEARATVIGRRDMADLFNLDRELVARNFDEVEQEMLRLSAPSILADYGARLVRVGIRRIALPAEATQTVQEAMKQDLQAKASRAREEGKSRANAIKKQAESDSRTIMAFAERRAEDIESTGVEASTRLLSEIQKQDSEFFIWLRFLEGLKEAFAQRGTIFLDSKDVIYPYFTNPTLPLREGAAMPLPEPTDRP